MGVLSMTHKMARTPALEIAYTETGPEDGPPVILLHGFPDDIHAYDGVAGPLAAEGWRVLVPWLRGYGPTRFLWPGTIRSGEQAALGKDLLDFMNALKIQRAVVGGYDWGGRAACVVAALWPERVHGLMSINGYNIQDIAAALQPASAGQELRHWYQWYFNTERGRAGLQANRRALCRYLWQLWSPSWHFSDQEYERTAASFDNPDFVDLVIHSYRHRNGSAPGDPRFAAIEEQLARRPKVQAPSITLYGAEDGVAPPARESSPAEAAAFATLVARRVIPGVGHFMPRERPEVVSSALLELLGSTR